MLCIVDWQLPTFWDNLLVSSAKVKQSGLMGYPEMSVTNYQSTLHNVPKQAALVV
jgi:hypothetical protein